MIMDNGNDHQTEHHNEQWKRKTFFLNHDNEESSHLRKYEIIKIILGKQCILQILLLLYL
jgi:hypothetical protein